MNFENEITVEVTLKFDQLKKLLEKYNFKIMEEYELDDIYMVPRMIDRKQDALTVLKSCVLIRHIISKEDEKKMITYKYKEFNENKDIVKQGKINCNIDSIDDVVALFKRLAFEELIHLNDKSIVFSNGEDELVVQEVNGKHIYIEIEDKCHFIDRTYKNIEEMQQVIKKYNIPMKDNNYFVKKAEIEMLETMK